ncbi:MAG TPA: sigma-70 family RNA polymerase sigma factor [Nocardioidaceae bacterium]|nr:sigma-70 family RNA polymerase sigma factor [Nocardioidaceae bacterium]
MTDLLSDIDVPSDAELISRVRGGDVAAYGELFARHRDAAAKLGRQLVRGPDADDLVAEAFAKVLQQLQGGGGPDVAFRAYLLTAVRRLHVDRIRAGSRLQTSDDMERYDAGIPFQDTAVAGFESGAAARAFASLPERWQLVLWHLEVENQKPAEVAPLLGMTPNSVSALAYRAREGLRQAFLTMHLAQAESEECRWTTEHLGAYVRKGLARRDVAKVEGHLEDCRRCTAMYLELSEVNSNLGALLGPLLLGGAAAGYLASSGSVGIAGVVSTLVGRVRDAFVANTAAATAGAVAAGVAAVGTAGFVVTQVVRDDAAEVRGIPSVVASAGAPGSALVSPSGPSTPLPSARVSPSAPSSVTPPATSPAAPVSSPAATVPALVPPTQLPGTDESDGPEVEDPGADGPGNPPGPPNQPGPGPTAAPPPTQPPPSEPAPSTPAPTKPVPTTPAPSSPAPTEPAPSDPAPTQPTPTDPGPTEPAPTDPGPTTTPTPPAIDTELTVEASLAPDDAVVHMTVSSDPLPEQIFVHLSTTGASGGGGVTFGDGLPAECEPVAADGSGATPDGTTLSCAPGDGVLATADRAAPADGLAPGRAPQARLGGAAPITVIAAGADVPAVAAGSGRDGRTAAAVYARTLPVRIPPDLGPSALELSVALPDDYVASESSVTKAPFSYEPRVARGLDHLTFLGPTPVDGAATYRLSTAVTGVSGSLDHVELRVTAPAALVLTAPPDACTAAPRPSLSSETRAYHLDCRRPATTARGNWSVPIDLVLAADTPVSGSVTMRILERSGYRQPVGLSQSGTLPAATPFPAEMIVEERSSKPGDGGGAVHLVEVTLTSLPDEPVDLTLDLRAGPDARVVLADGAPKGCRLSDGSSEKPWTVTCTETATALTIPLRISRPNVDAGELTATLLVPDGYFAPTPPSATVPLSAIEVQEPPAAPRLSVEAQFVSLFDWWGWTDAWDYSRHRLILHVTTVASPLPAQLRYTLGHTNGGGPSTFANARGCGADAMLACLVTPPVTCETGATLGDVALSCPLSTKSPQHLWFLVDVPEGQHDKTTLTVSTLDHTHRSVTVPVQPPVGE